MSDNAKAIKRLILGLAEMYGEQFTELRLGIYASALADLTPEEVERAVTEISRDPNQTRFPLPAHIREKVQPTSTIEDAANLLLDRAVQAVARFGYVDPGGAKDYLGEIGWRAIGSENGWADLCTAEIPQGTLRAQLRGRISAGLRRESPSGRIRLPSIAEAPLRLAVPWPGDEQRQQAMEIAKVDFTQIGKGIA